MFRPGGERGIGNSSESESDWDTTTDFATPRNTGGSDSLRSTLKDDVQQKPPTPRTRATVSVPGRGDRTDDGTPSSARQDDALPASARKDSSLQASALPAYQSPRDSGSRSRSPVPPYTSGFRDAIKSDDSIGKGGPPPSPKVDNKNSRYEPSRTPRGSSNTVDADNIDLPKWDDSDAEEQTLREVHTTFKKERNREIESESARRHTPDDVDRLSTTGQHASVLERWMQGREEKKRKQKDAMIAASAGKPDQKAVSARWLRGGDHGDPVGMDAPYQSFMLKDEDGRRFLYFFNEGNTAFYEVEEEDTEAIMPRVADKAEKFIKRGWQEFFGALRIVTSLMILLCVEALNFMTNHVARPLLQTVLVNIGNHIVKPSLAAVFNLIVQPMVIFLWNVMSGLRHVSQPVIDVIGGVLSKVAILLGAFRLVTVEYGGGGGGDRRTQNWRVVGVAGRGVRSDSEIV